MKAESIGHKEVQRLQDEGAQILDALPVSDYRQTHVAGAINVPLESFSVELIRNLDRERPTITYCADNECDLGPRLAARLLFEGFTQVYEYSAGLADWSAFGLPLEGEAVAVARAGDLARKDFCACSPDERASEVIGRFGDQSLCAVLDPEGIVLGRLLKQDAHADGDSRAVDLARPGPSTFRPDVPVSEMAEWFQKRPQIDAFIITTPDGRAYGVLYRADVERVVRRAGERRASSATKS